MRADARRNRAQILTSAVDLFAERGVAVPVDDIARGAGVGVGTLYRHFPTKEALFEAVLEDRVLRLAAEADALLGTDDPGWALFHFLERMVEEATAKRDLLDALAGSGINMKALAMGPRRRLEQVGAALLERAQAAGAVRADVVFGDLLHLVAGACVLEDPNGDGQSGERLLAVVCDGLRAHAPVT
jgi:AcrR family transcriptional regulator